MDEPKSRRIDWAAAVPITLLVVSTIIMVVPTVFGISLLGISDREALIKLLGSFSHSPFAPLSVILVFILLGFTGFPQFLLIGSAAAIFGFGGGFIYSSIGTMLSAMIGFSDRAALPVARSCGDTAARWCNARSEILGRRGIFASGIVQLIPCGPFIMVNMIAGASHMRLWQFLLGAGLGIIPKTVLFALVGSHLVTFLREKDVTELVAVTGLLLASVVLGFWFRRRFLKSEPVEGPLARAASEGLPARPGEGEQVP